MNAGRGLSEALETGVGHHHTPCLAAALEEMADACSGAQGFTLDELHRRLADRTWFLLLLVLPLPFISPIPVPGLSTPFGIALAAIGIGLVVGRPPRLPRWVRTLRCPPGFVARVIAATARQVARLRALVRPRWAWLAGRSWTRVLGGVVIVVSGILLALPLPIPFSNALPAYAILLTGIGLAQRDGVAILLGQIAFLLTVAYFVSIGWGIAVGLSWLG
jgi:hypothetical protein